MLRNFVSLKRFYCCCSTYIKHTQIIKLQLKDINKHSWVIAGGKGEVHLGMSMIDVIQTHIIPSANDLDTDVLQAISSLGCFKDREKLIAALLSVE